MTDPGQTMAPPAMLRMPNTSAGPIQGRLERDPSRLFLSGGQKKKGAGPCDVGATLDLHAPPRQYTDGVREREESHFLMSQKQKRFSTFDTGLKTLNGVALVPSRFSFWRRAVPSFRVSIMHPKHPPPAPPPSSTCMDDPRHQFLHSPRMHG